MDFNETEVAVVRKINECLKDGYEARLNFDGRLYYNNHGTLTSSWLPPCENWNSGVSKLPYGWECALDQCNKPYFINHVDTYTTKDDPRNDPDYVEPPKPREVELVRDPQKGFGFVAGSEKPVIVRFVTEGGPSVDKLLPGDQLIKINGEDIHKSPREYVIDLVRSCKDTIQLTVCQPYINNTSRKSALLTAAKRAKLKTNPSRVRFAESVTINGASVVTPSNQESYVPLMPNVLKVFLENGQTKSFKYDNATTVKDVLDSLQEKLDLEKIDHFALVLQNMKMLSHGKMTLLQEHEVIADIAARPGAMHLRCLFRIVYVPRDAYDLLNDDRVAFEYFYMQCCNDVVNERFTSELKYDTALRLGALHIQEHFTSNNGNAKISVKNIQRDCGLDKFVPRSLMDNMKTKDMRKLMQQYLKLNQSLSAPGQKHLTALQAKLHYLKIVGELKTFGSRVFMVTLVDKKTEAMVLVGPRYGIGLVTNIKSYTIMCLADFDQIASVTVTPDGDCMQRVDVLSVVPNEQPISLALLNDDVGNFVSLVEGYYRLFVDRHHVLTRTMHNSNNNTDEHIPPYLDVHRVLPCPWSYPQLDSCSEQDERMVDLSRGPPLYEDNPALRIQAESGKMSQTTERLMSSPSNTGCHNQNVPPSDNERSQTIAITCSDYEEGVTSFTDDIDQDIAVEAEMERLDGQRIPISGDMSSSLNLDDDEFRSFRRYIPSPIVSHTRRISLSHGHSNAENAPSGSSFTVEDQEKTFITLTKITDDNVSDNDSVYSGADVEKTPLLLHSERSTDDCEGHLSLMNDPPSQSGSDTDSMCDTPDVSPYRTKTGLTLDALPAADVPQSFGLHSPDEFPATEIDYHKLATSFGLHSPDQIPSEIYEAIYDPRSLVDNGLYIDPDIIAEKKQAVESAIQQLDSVAASSCGQLPPEWFLFMYALQKWVRQCATVDRDLTLLAPPKTPDEDHMMDFSAVTDHAGPPPAFADEDASRNAKNTFDNLHLGAETDIKAGAGDESDSGNETVSSENVDIATSIQEYAGHGSSGVRDYNESSDIPSSQFNVITTNLLNQHRTTHPLRITNTIVEDEIIDLSESNVAISSDDELAALIIPPPPPSSAINEISIVPPVHDLTFSSSSVNLKDFLHLKQSEQKRGNCLPKAHSESDNVSGQSNVNTSPLFVSEQLSNLLHSIPSISETRSCPKSERCVRRNQISLRLSHSNSLDEDQSSNTNLNYEKSSTTTTNQLSELKVNVEERCGIESENVAKSLNCIKPKPRKSFVLRQLMKSRSIDTVQNSEISDGLIPDANNKADTFAALKTKLQEYRDMLLSRREASRQLRDDAEDHDEDSESQSSSASCHDSSTVTDSELNTYKESPSSQTSHISSTTSSLVEKVPEKADIVQSTFSQRIGTLKPMFSTLPISFHSKTTMRPVSAMGIPEDGKRRPLKLSRVLHKTYSMESEMTTKHSTDSETLTAGGQENTDMVNIGKKESPSQITRDVDVGSVASSGMRLCRKNRNSLSEVDATLSTFGTLPRRKPNWLMNDSIVKSVQPRDEEVVQESADLRLRTMEDMMWRPLRRTFSDEERVRHKDSDWSQELKSDHSLAGRMGYVTCGEHRCDIDRLDMVEDPKHEVNAARINDRRGEVGGSEASGIVTQGYTMAEDRLRSVTIDVESRTLSNCDNPNKNSSDNMETFQDVASERPETQTEDSNYSSKNGSPAVSLVMSSDTLLLNRNNSNSLENKQSKTVASESVSSGTVPNSLVDSPLDDIPIELLNHTSLLHNSLIRTILSKDYSHDTQLRDCLHDVDRLLVEMRTSMETLHETPIEPDVKQLAVCKDEMISITKQFVMDAKLLVASITRSSDTVWTNVTKSMHTLARVFLHGHATILLVQDNEQAQGLALDVIRVANAYKNTLNAARISAGQPINEPHLKYIMKLATSLANFLSNLLTRLKSVSSSNL